MHSCQNECWMLQLGPSPLNRSCCMWLIASIPWSLKLAKSTKRCCRVPPLWREGFVVKVGYTRRQKPTPYKLQFLQMSAWWKLGHSPAFWPPLLNCKKNLHRMWCKQMQEYYMISNSNRKLLAQITKTWSNETCYLPSIPRFRECAPNLYRITRHPFFLFAACAVVLSIS